MKKTVMCAAAIAMALGFGFTSSVMAADKGPAEIVLQATKDAAAKPKPATFPHAKHQEKFGCKECHHSKGADGKQAAFVEGQKIEKCETCHFKGSGMANDKVATFKDAAHVNCKGCHTEKNGPKASDCKSCHK